MYKNKMIGFFLAASLFTSGAFAGTVSSVDWGIRDDSGMFYCVVTHVKDNAAKVKIDTSGVDANGFCKGYRSYVTQDGHIDGMPLSTFTKSCFQIRKNKLTSGHITAEVKVTGAEIACSKTRSCDKPLFGNGNFC